MKPRPSPQAILPVDASVHSAREAAAAAARGRASRAPVWRAACAPANALAAAACAPAAASTAPTRTPSNRPSLTSGGSAGILFYVIFNANDVYTSTVVCQTLYCPTRWRTRSHSPSLSTFVTDTGMWKRLWFQASQPLSPQH